MSDHIVNITSPLVNTIFFIQSSEYHDIWYHRRPTHPNSTMCSVGHCHTINLTHYVVSVLLYVLFFTCLMEDQKNKENGLQASVVGKTKHPWCRAKFCNVHEKKIKIQESIWRANMFWICIYVEFQDYCKFWMGGLAADHPLTAVF